ncbi:hypothetical protein ZIOFF_024534 [Zingiber officinale]|uniref:Kinesin motor domain-containing protein n=1 Tax=Zingiber officinale TaxID=94328 RepID=A0A8J5H0K6_ZINOF|nr:hypothetical protein ZIOFF_024534 [Zingiber officinale]
MKSSHSNDGLHLANAAVARPTDTDCDASRIRRRMAKNSSKSSSDAAELFSPCGSDEQAGRGFEGRRLDIKQASDGTQDVPGLLEPQVGSIDDVWEILTNGGRTRSVGSTNANELSSRSHS